MSSPHVIVAAVHEPEESIEEWWDKYSQSLDGFEKELDYNDEVEWYMSEGEFKSTEARKTFPVKPAYHSNRGEEVIEVVLSCEDDIRDIQMTGLGDVIEEINYRLDPDFTLEVYYWYDGVDKPGGVSR